VIEAVERGRGARRRRMACCSARPHLRAADYRGGAALSGLRDSPRPCSSAPAF